MKLKSPNTTVTPLIVINKMKNWCAYQERSQCEAREKLYKFKLEPETVEEIISGLITENYLNEERFAIAFAGGKFRIKHWGRVKIKAALRKHKLSDYCIKKALDSINENEYEKTLLKVLDKKIAQTKTTDRYKLYHQILSYAASRGFEGDLINEQLKLTLGSY